MRPKIVSFDQKDYYCTLKRSKKASFNRKEARSTLAEIQRTIKILPKHQLCQEKQKKELKKTFPISKLNHI